MYTINRSAIILLPKKPFLEWLNSVEQDGNQWTLNEVRSNPQVFLIDLQENEVGAEHHVKNTYSNLFNRVLEEWIMERHLWPTNITLDMFYDWFDIYYYSTVIDTNAEEIEKQDITE